MWKTNIVLIIPLHFYQGLRSTKSLLCSSFSRCFLFLLQNVTSFFSGSLSVTTLVGLNEVNSQHFLTLTSCNVICIYINLIRRRMFLEPEEQRGSCWWCWCKVRCSLPMLYGLTSHVRVYDEEEGYKSCPRLSRHKRLHSGDFKLYYFQ